VQYFALHFIGAFFLFNFSFISKTIQKNVNMKSINLKLLWALVISIIISFTSFGQSTNPAEASGYAGDSQDFWDNTPHLLLSPESEITLLPNEVDNSLLMYFPWTYYQGELMRHIYIQGGNGACAAVSTVHYTLTYELNRVREAYGLYDENKCPANFTWNFLNGGNFPSGSSFEGNLNILKTNGCPSCLEWENCEEATYEEDYTLWMHGYDKYFSSYHNRIESYEQITPMYNPEKNDLMKHWLADHNEGSETGGLIVFATFGACTGTETVPDGIHAGEIVVVEWGTACNHAMTIVGYNDEDIKWDFNGDGQYTNTIDLNDDNIIDVRDWEIGAFIVVGLGHYEYAQDGFVWVMYKTIAECTNQTAIVEHVDDGYEPEIEIQGQITHNKRNNIKVRMANGDNANSTPPPTGSTSWKTSFFNNAGGANPMQGIGNDPWLEFSLNYGYHFGQSDFGKVFFGIKSNSSEAGTLNYWKLTDRRWGEVFELDYPQTNINLPVNSDLMLEIPYDLIPHETSIITNLTLSSDMVSRFTPTVALGATLTVEDGVDIDMYNSEIHIETLSSLIVEDNVTFTAKRGICKVIVNGNATFGSNVQFIAEDDAQIWLEINNTALNLAMNSPVFETGVIIAYNNQLTLTNPSFTDGGIYGFNGNFDIIGGQFNHSFVHIDHASSSSKVANINGCVFNGSGTTAIDIDNYPNFRIDNNTITGHSDAINLYNCGYGAGFQQISNCVIYDNSTTGILLYRSSADIYHNHITNSGFGIKSFDRSAVHIEGNNHYVTQIIKDNKWNEIYASKGGFPQYLHWNLIQDDFNEPGDPMVKYTGNDVFLDVRNNCWGNTFDPLLDLEPLGGYNWDPVWKCLIGSGSASSSEAEALYLDARERIEAEDYAVAKADFEQILDEYPETEFANAAMKELFPLEELTGNNYNSLKEYYNTHSAIQGDPELAKLADFLANFCEIKLENWPTAIAWFEDVVENPETMEDSIFAIIDMGYTYWLMENGGLKSTYTGKMGQYKFSSREEFEDNRDFLLSLLPGDQLSETMKQSISTLKSGELLQNVPNPFNGTTQIWFKLAEESSVSVTIYDYTGKEVSVINPGSLKSGNHSVEFNSSNLSSGIYFYSLEVNGIKTDTKKMTLMK
jgi:hypothetical protein